MTLPETIDLGDGFVLERATTAHANELARAVGDSLTHLEPWMPWADPSQAVDDTQRRRLEAVRQLWDRSEEFQFVLRHDSDPGVLGAIGLICSDRWSLGRNTIEIGYWMHVDWCGRGLATRAADALTRASFELGATQQVAIVCDEANGASAAIPRKLGFTLERVVRRLPEAPGESGRMQIWLRSRAPTGGGGSCDSNS